MLGTAISEDTSEETAGETNDEHDEEEKPHLKPNHNIPTPEGKIPSLDPRKTSNADDEEPEEAEGDVDLSVGSSPETKGDPLSTYEKTDHKNHIPEATNTEECCTSKTKAMAYLARNEEENLLKQPTSSTPATPRPHSTVAANT